MGWIAAQLGFDLMPWQRQVLEVALEVRPDGVPWYREVVVTVPRQSGKTTLLLAAELQRVLMWARVVQRVVYSAQTGADGRKKLLEDQAPLLKASVLRPAIASVYRTMGAEGLVFVNGSRIDVQASSEAAGHGRVVDLGILDEAFSDVDDRREQALVPAMATRRDAQVWVISTAGHEGSAYLARKVQAGQAAVADGRDEGLAYFEWSAAPGADAESPATWRSCMPALGHTIDEAVVRHALASMSRGEFERAFLNRWTVAEDRVIPAATWNAICSDGLELGESLVFGVDVAVDRGHASIVAVDGDRKAELVEHREGVGWLVERLVQLSARWSAPVAADEVGPVAPLLPDLEAAGVTVERYGARRMAAACARLYDAVADRLVKVRQHPDLDAAAAAARKRVAGDAWYWARRDARTDVSPLVALTVAYDLAVGRGREGSLWAQWG